MEVALVQFGRAAIKLSMLLVRHGRDPENSTCAIPKSVTLRSDQDKKKHPIVLKRDQTR